QSSPRSLQFHLLSFVRVPRPPRPTLFPYTTLFRSRRRPPETRRGRPASRSPSPLPGAARPSLRRGRRPCRAPPALRRRMAVGRRSEEHTSELQSPDHLVCRLLLEKKKKNEIHAHEI